MKKKNLLKCLALTSMLALSVGALASCGTQGAKGEKGDTGATGATGAPGKDGVDGKDGTNGTNGTDGKTYLPIIMVGYVNGATPVSYVINQDKYFVEPGESFTLSWEDNAVYQKDFKGTIIVDLEINGESVDVAPDAGSYTYTATESDKGFQITSASFYTIKQYAQVAYQQLWNSYAEKDVALSTLDDDLKGYTAQEKDETKHTAFPLAAEYLVESLKLQTVFGKFDGTDTYTGLLGNIMKVVAGFKSTATVSEKLAAINEQYTKDATTLEEKYQAAVKAYKTAAVEKVKDLFPQYKVNKKTDGEVTGYTDSLVATADGRAVKGSDGSTAVAVEADGEVSVLNMNNDDRKTILDAATASLNGATTISGLIDLLTADGTNGSVAALETKRSAAFNIFRGSNVLADTTIAGYILESKTYKKELKALGLAADGPLGVANSYLETISAATSIEDLADTDDDKATLKYSVVKEGKAAIKASYTSTVKAAIASYLKSWSDDINAYLEADVAATMIASVKTALTNVTSFADLWGTAASLIKVQLTGAGDIAEGGNYIEAIEAALSQNTTLNTARLSKYATEAKDELAAVVKEIRDNDSVYNATLLKADPDDATKKVDDDTKGILATAKTIKTSIASATTVAQIIKIEDDLINGTENGSVKKGYAGEVTAYRATVNSSFVKYLGTLTKLSALTYSVSTTDAGGNDLAHLTAAIAALSASHVDSKDPTSDFVYDTMTKLDTLYAADSEGKVDKTTIGYKMGKAIEDINDGYNNWLTSNTDAGYTDAEFIRTANDGVWTNIVANKGKVLSTELTDGASVVTSTKLNGDYTTTVSTYLANAIKVLGDYVTKYGVVDTATNVTIGTDTYNAPGTVSDAQLAAARKKVTEIGNEDKSKVTTVTKVNEFVDKAHVSILTALGYVKA